MYPQSVVQIHVHKVAIVQRPLRTRYMYTGIHCLEVAKDLSANNGLYRETPGVVDDQQHLGMMQEYDGGKRMGGIR